jgi:glycosyltransferase involved in cell wall biosynthesis
MKIAILWTRLSGYMNACLKVLAQNSNVDILVVHQAPSKDAPFKEDDFFWISHRYGWDRHPSEPDLIKKLEEFKPDVVLVSSWHIRGYRAALRSLPKGVVRVLCMDNLWRGTARQWLGILTSRWFLHPFYDVAFVPGDRQVIFARKLGFEEDCIWRGLYTCDHLRFSHSYRQREASKYNLSQSFVYVGRLSSEKGIETLIKAYKGYRTRVKKPWPLVVAGEGPLRFRLEGIQGIAVKGFMQPECLARELSESGCLILPSSFEPWGLVTHEATAAGLPVICSNACGASAHLVQDGFNGFIVEAGKPVHLTDAMYRFSLLSEDQRRSMGHNSFLLSKQFTPELWASNLYQRAKALMEDKIKGRL